MFGRRPESTFFTEVDCMFCRICGKNVESNNSRRGMKRSEDLKIIPPFSQRYYPVYVLAKYRAIRELGTL